MADGDPLPSGDHVLRFCSRRTLASGRATAGAFAVRERDEGRLSTNWVECRHVAQDERNVESSIARLHRMLRISAQDRVAVLPVDDVRSIRIGDSLLEIVEFWGANDNRCHAAIVGLGAAAGPVVLLAQIQLARIANERLLDPMRNRRTKNGAQYQVD
jgi:hypothetical protein